jgi:hypothetical protein
MKGKAVAGLVLGIVAIVLGFLGGYMSIISLPAAIVGLCLSVSGGKGLKAAGQPHGVATAGLVLGIIAVVLTAIFFFTCGLCTICAASAANDIVNSYY